jgi:hypothetical protein
MQVRVQLLQVVRCLSQVDMEVQVAVVLLQYCRETQNQMSSVFQLKKEIIMGALLTKIKKIFEIFFFSRRNKDGRVLSKNI